METTTRRSTHEPMNFDYFLARLTQPISENHIKGMVLSGLFSTIFTLNPASVALSVGLRFLASSIDLVVRPVLDRFIATIFNFELNKIFTNLITSLFVITATFGISSALAGVIGSAFVVDKLVTFLMTMVCSTIETPVHVFL